MGRDRCIRENSTMTPKKHHPQYDAIAGMLGRVVNAIRRKRPAGHPVAIATGQFECLGNSHREMVESIRASARRDLRTSTGSWVRRIGSQR
jgi:hypothetical protein